MASLLIGLLLNVVIRSGEFLLAVPALSTAAPDWGQTLFHVMAADVAVMGFFYMVCFVMALRSVPYFPKMLLFVWGLDILAQLLIAQTISPLAGLPASVALPLQDLLTGNITKVLDQRVRLAALSDALGPGERDLSPTGAIGDIVWLETRQAVAGGTVGVHTIARSLLFALWRWQLSEIVIGIALGQSGLLAYRHGWMA